MKKLLLLSAALLLATPAFASGNTCIGNANCSTTTNDNDPITTTSSASATASPVTTNVNTAVGGAGGSAKIERGAVDVDIETKNLNNNFNLTHVGVENANRQKQGQVQGQFQGQFQGQDQHQKVEDSGNSSIVWNERRQTAAAYAGSASIASDSCGSSVGAGGQGPAFGFSFNFARDDETCELIKLSRRLTEVGHGDGAVRILCQDDRVAEALPAVCKKD